jgi:hypothetical protein
MPSVIVDRGNNDERNPIKSAKDARVEAGGSIGYLQFERPGGLTV